MEGLKELDRIRDKKDRRAGFYGEADDHDAEGPDGVDPSEIADIVD